MAFKDHFSAHAALYAAARPTYPPQLFAFIADCCNGHDAAWDCATGNGQAARGIAPWFETVLATDASAEQIAMAPPSPGISYVTSPAERCPAAAQSMDLVTVAQALHWFDVPAFMLEAQRVLRSRGILAVWCYGLHRIIPAVDDVVGRLYGPLVGAYWPAERRHVENGYRDLSFPFPAVDTPPFAMELEWNLEQLTAYLYSWSAVQRYMKVTGADPVALVLNDLGNAWGRTARRAVHWPLALYIGRKP